MTSQWITRGPFCCCFKSFWHELVQHSDALYCKHETSACISNEKLICILVQYAQTRNTMHSTNDLHTPSVTMPVLLPVHAFLQFSPQERMPTGQSDQVMHGAGLSVAISCQKSTMNTCATSYITEKESTHTRTHIRATKNLKQLQWKAEFKQELLQHSNPIFHRWHQQLLVKDVQLPQVYSSICWYVRDVIVN